jgi:hypothetical protein
MHADEVLAVLKKTYPCGAENHSVRVLDRRFLIYLCYDVNKSAVFTTVQRNLTEKLVLEEALRHIPKQFHPKDQYMNLKSLFTSLHKIYPCKKAKHNLTLHEGRVMLTVFKEDTKMWHSVYLDEADLKKPLVNVLKEIKSFIPVGKKEKKA